MPAYAIRQAYQCKFISASHSLFTRIVIIHGLPSRGELGLETLSDKPAQLWINPKVYLELSSVLLDI